MGAVSCGTIRVVPFMLGAGGGHSMDAFDDRAVVPAFFATIDKVVTS